MRLIAFVSASTLVLGLVGCGKLQSLIKGEPADAAASVAAPTPSAPEVATAAADAAPATTAPVASAHHTVVKSKDGGVADAAADAAVDAAVAAVPAKKPTRGEFSCEASGCECESGAGCQISCPGVSPCKVVVRELANASITGALGAVEVECKKGSTCKLRGGVGASNVRCNGGNCTTDCGTGACTMTCSGGKCAVNKKGAGAVKCTGSVCS